MRRWRWGWLHFWRETEAEVLRGQTNDILDGLEAPLDRLEAELRSIQGEIEEIKEMRRTWTSKSSFPNQSG